MNSSTTSNKTNPLTAALDYVRDDMALVNDCIRQQMSSDVMMIPAISEYIISNGGKRLRPLLCLLTARLFPHHSQRHIPLAVVTEFLHTASLLHDDVVDSSLLRRGEPSANGVWGNQASVLVGDFLFSRALQMMVADQDWRVIALLSNVTNALAEGEVLQLVRTFHLEMTEAQCLEVIERKTAVLFAAAAELGGLINHRSEASCKALNEYGMCLGVAFQLMDDALDYAASAAEVGKPVGHDLEEGKITYPLIHAMRASQEIQQQVAGIAERGHYKNDEERCYIRQQVETLGGIDATLAEAQRYVQRAIKALPSDGDPKTLELLKDLASFSAQRNF